MNGNALIRILATFGLLIASLWVSFDIFTSGSNAVARFYMYAMIACGIYGLLNARKAFYLLLFLTAYLDFFKRFMIFDSALSRMDLYYVLGIAPATLGGIVGNILYQHFTGRLPSRPGINKLILVTLAVIAFALILALTRGGGGFRAFGDSVNATVYLSLLFVVPVLFRTPEELRHMLKALVIIYIPSILYMIVHYMNGGIFDWEMDYVKSGLTTEIRQLMERVFRPFGTLNSAANASMIFAAIMALCFSGMWSKPDRDGRTMPMVMRYLLIPVIALAMFATYSRTGWVFAVVAVIAAPMLRFRGLTLAGYGLSVVAVVTVILASPWMVKHKILNEISEDVYAQKRTDQWAQTTNLATLNDRLEGFYGLVTEPDAWTPFGLRFGSASESAVRSKVPTHDKFTDILLDYGYVTILIGAIIIGRNLWKLHSMLFQEREPLVKSIGVTCLAIGLAMTSGGLVNGAQFLTYPVNVFIWLNFSVGVALWIYVRERDLAEAPATTKDTPPWLNNPVRVAVPRPAAMPVPAHSKA